MGMRPLHNQPTLSWRFRAWRKGCVALCVAAVIASCAPTDRPVDAEKSRDTPQTLRIVGSSTVFPFAAKVAEIMSDRTGIPIVVEQTGSGGGHKLFCDGARSGGPDITNSSRPQKASEYAMCRQNGVAPVVEIQIGYDGIVLARSIDAQPMMLSLEQLYLALSKDIPVSDADGMPQDTECQFIPNPYQLWSEIDQGLPNERIEVYGPPPTSGTRDAFVETAIAFGARRLPCLARLETSDNAAFQRRAQTLREDGRWIDAGENDNTLIQILINTPSAMGIVGFSFLDQNLDKVDAVAIDGFAPDFEAIREGRYPIVRSLFLYLSGANMAENPAIAAYGMEFTSDRAAGPSGYLEQIGLIPLPHELRNDMRRRIEVTEDYRRPTPTGQRP